MATLTWSPINAFVIPAAIIGIAAVIGALLQFVVHRRVMPRLNLSPRFQDGERKVSRTERRIVTVAPCKKSTRKYGPTAQREVESAIHEMKRSEPQAIAIGLSEARQEGAKLPPAPAKRAIRSNRVSNRAEKSSW